MLAKSGLILAAAFGIVLLTGGAADAQVVTVRANYIAPSGQYPARTWPSGTFSTPIYPDGSGGRWRVKVNYGTIVNGQFQPFTVGVNSSTYYSGGVDVQHGVTSQAWGVPGPQHWPNGLGQHTYVRAQLQRSTDGGTTWTDQGTPSYDQCRP
jgi:hypothetical protein